MSLRTWLVFCLLWSLCQEEHLCVSVGCLPYSSSSPQIECPFHFFPLPNWRCLPLKPHIRDSLGCSVPIFHLRILLASLHRTPLLPHLWTHGFSPCRLSIFHFVWLHLPWVLTEKLLRKSSTSVLATECSQLPPSPLFPKWFSRELSSLFFAQLS